MTTTVTRRTAPDRFEVEVDGEVAGFTQFVDRDGRRVFTHTEVDPAFEGQGLAGTVVREALDATVDEGLTIVPVCEYVAHYVEKHDDWSGAVEAPGPEDRRVATS